MWARDVCRLRGKAVWGREVRLISIGAQRQSQCHTRRAETCCDPSSTNTAVSEQPSARLRRTLCMHAEVKRARWPHLGFFRSPQRFGHSPKLPARPLHGPRLGTQWFAATWRARTRCPSLQQFRIEDRWGLRGTFKQNLPREVGISGRGEAKTCRNEDEMRV